MFKNFRSRGKTSGKQTPKRKKFLGAVLLGTLMGLGSVNCTADFPKSIEEICARSDAKERLACANTDEILEKACEENPDLLACLEKDYLLELAGMLGGGNEAEGCISPEISQSITVVGGELVNSNEEETLVTQTIIKTSLKCEGEEEKVLSNISVFEPPLNETTTGEIQIPEGVRYYNLQTDGELRRYGIEVQGSETINISRAIESTINGEVNQNSTVGESITLGEAEYSMQYEYVQSIEGPEGIEHEINATMQLEIDGQYGPNEVFTINLKDQIKEKILKSVNPQISGDMLKHFIIIEIELTATRIDNDHILLESSYREFFDLENGDLCSLQINSNSPTGYSCNIKQIGFDHNESGISVIQMDFTSNE